LKESEALGNGHANETFRVNKLSFLRSPDSVFILFFIGGG